MFSVPPVICKVPLFCQLPPRLKVPPGCSFHVAPTSLVKVPEPKPISVPLGIVVTPCMSQVPARPPPPVSPMVLEAFAALTPIVEVNVTVCALPVC